MILKSPNTKQSPQLQQTLPVRKKDRIPKALSDVICQRRLVSLFDDALSAVNMEEREALKREIEVLQGNVLIRFVRNPESPILVAVSFRFSYLYECAILHEYRSFIQARGGFRPFI